MRSTFQGFTAAKSGLFAAQTSLDIVGHNVANVNTKGYSRQRLEQTNAIPIRYGGLGMMGTGVAMKQVTQIRDEFLDIQFRDESEKLGWAEFRNQMLNQIGTVFNEPTENGIRNVMDKFYTALHSLSENSSDPTNRSVFLQSAVAVTENLNNMGETFEKYISDVDEEVTNTVKAINTYADDIALLNKQILSNEIGLEKANDLRDKRNVLIDELSKIADIDVVEIVSTDHPEIPPTINVLLQGNGLVMHDSVSKIRLVPNQQHPMYLDSQQADPPREDLKGIRVTNIEWENGSYIYQSKLGGTLGAQLEMRDNFEGEAKGIPYYVRVINEFSATFAQAFNDVHKTGYDRNPPGNTTPSGNDFFASMGDPSNPSRITARTIRVNEAILDQPALVAAGGESGAESDNKNVLELLKIRDQLMELEIKYQPGTPPSSTKPDQKLLQGKPDDLIKSLIGVLGVDGQEAIRIEKNQLIITQQIDTYRMSVSGVSQDEEMSNMLKFNHAYNAAARMITTMDEMIDVIINRMGRVGL